MRVLKQKIRTIGWAFGLAWKINKWIMIFWYSISITLSILPAVMLHFNREIISIISNYLMYGGINTSELVTSVVVLGVLLTLIGLSSRVNGDLVYMMMYDSYYIGMQEYLMDSMQKIKIVDILKSEINDEYRFVIGRAGSLTDLMSSFCSIIGKLASIVSLMVVAFSISKIIFFISLTYVVAILIINFFFTERTREYQVRKDQRLASYYEMLPFNPGAAKEIRIFNNSAYFMEQWNKAYSAVMYSNNKRSIAIEIRNSISGIGFYIFLIIMILNSIYAVSNRGMSPDIFIMVYTLCMNVYSAISGLAHNIIGFDHGLFALERQMEFVKIIPQVNNSHDDYLQKEKEAIEIDVTFKVENLVFGYKPEEKIIKNISFEVKKGEVIALVGANGSGKSTLIKLLLNMLQPNSGKILFSGKSYNEYPAEYIRRKIGVFFQDFYLFHTSLGDNVGYGNIDDIYNEHLILDAVIQGGADSVMEKLPHGLSTLIGRNVDQKGAELSGGEKQRIAAARAHMNNKDILIFDEPASALDPIAEMNQFLGIREKIMGRTAILVSHRVGFARLADRIIVMHKGNIVETGTHDNLMSLNGYYSNFFHEQAQWYEDEKVGE